MLKNNSDIIIHSNNDYDEIIIKMYFILIDAYNECQNYGGPYKNLVGLFFHEFMFFLSSALFRKQYSKKQTLSIEERNEISKASPIPYLGYRSNKETYINKITVSNSRKIFELFSKTFGNSNRKIGILNPALDFKKFSYLLVLNKFNVTFPEKVSIQISKIDKQRSIVISTLEKLYKKFDLLQNRKLLISAMDATLNAVISEKGIMPEYSLLLMGAPTLNCRILAAESLSKQIPVICLAHGNECGTGDCPSWGYDERSYCTHFMGYGRGGLIEENQGMYLQSLSGVQPEYFQANSKFIQSIHKKENKIPCLSAISSAKVAYFPDKLLGLDRLGPFMSILDDEYVAWQIYLFQIFPEMVYKKHPKQKIETNLQGIKVVTSSIEECLSQFDVLVLDCSVSTTFANLAATSKPIIYFNIGMGNHTPTAEKMVRERSIWIDVDLKSPGNLVDKVKLQENKVCINNYTSNFCMAYHSEDREDTTIRVMNELINK